MFAGIPIMSGKDISCSLFREFLSAPIRYSSSRALTTFGTQEGQVEAQKFARSVLERTNAEHILVDM